MSDQSDIHSSSVFKDDIPGTSNCPNFVPTLPTLIRDARYQGDVRVELAPAVVLPGTHFSSAPSYGLQEWTMSIHPEGKHYAFNTAEDGISIVTEARVKDPSVAAQLEKCLAMLRDIVAEENIQLPASTDLFLEIDQDTETCSYWFADHAHRTVFWLHPVDTEMVGLSDSHSSGHPEYYLGENYWAHVEMFPATSSQYSATALNELTVILLNARADALTSEIPTFPYTADECERFIDLLTGNKEHASNPYIATFVARLWVVVANHRLTTHFSRYQGDVRVKPTLHEVAPSSQDHRIQPVLPSRQPLVVARTVATQVESSSQPLSSATEAQHQQEQRTSQQGIPPALPTENSATFLSDRVSSIVNTDPPPIPAGDQLATPVQYPPIPSDSVGNPPAGFVAIPATAPARGNSLKVENLSEAREARDHVQHLIDSWIGDAQTVLKFNGVFIPTVASFIIESYKWLSPDIGPQISQNPSPPPAASIIILNVLWLTSLVLNITSTLFATSTLMLQWTRRYTQVARSPRDYMYSLGIFEVAYLVLLPTSTVAQSNFSIRC